MLKITIHKSSNYIVQASQIAEGTIFSGKLVPKNAYYCAVGTFLRTRDHVLILLCPDAPSWRWKALNPSEVQVENYQENRAELIVHQGG